jgi:hypothetical protein
MRKRFALLHGARCSTAVGRTAKNGAASCSMKFAGGAGNEQPTQPSRTLGSRPADAGGTGAAHAWIGATEQLIVQVNRMAIPTSFHVQD